MKKQKYAKMRTVNPHGGREGGKRHHRQHRQRGYGWPYSSWAFSPYYYSWATPSYYTYGYPSYYPYGYGYPYFGAYPYSWSYPYYGYTTPTAAVVV